MARNPNQERIEFHPKIRATRALKEMADFYPGADRSELLERLCDAGIWAIKTWRTVPTEPRGPRNRWR